MTTRCSFPLLTRIGCMAYIQHSGTPGGLRQMFHAMTGLGALTVTGEQRLSRGKRRLSKRKGQRKRRRKARKPPVPFLPRPV